MASERASTPLEATLHLAAPAARCRSGPSRAAAQVWRLVSGYPPGKRERRIMVVLVDPQLAADASGNDPLSPFFVIAGFIAPAAKWADFSAAWQISLDRPPGLEYFKMSEAANMSGQFDRRCGWTEPLRDVRVAELASIARDYASVRVSAWIRRSDYDTHIASLPAVERHLGVDSPYVTLVNQLILAIAVHGEPHGITSPCDYIFDSEEGFDEEVFAIWPVVKKSLQTARSDIAEFVGERPIFRNDKCFLPLQAADLYAWQVRNHITNNNRLPNQTIKIPANPILRMFDQMGQINREYPADEVLRLREALLRMGKQFAQLQPDVELVGPISDARKRRRAYKKVRRSRKRASQNPSASSRKKSS
jgi:hypothetical protein